MPSERTSAAYPAAQSSSASSVPSVASSSTTRTRTCPPGACVYREKRPMIAHAHRTVRTRRQPVPQSPVACTWRSGFVFAECELVVAFLLSHLGKRRAGTCVVIQLVHDAIGAQDLDL